MNQKTPKMEATPKRTPQNKRKKKTVENHFQTAIENYPEIAEELKQVSTYYANKEFLPKLKDLKRFLQQYQQDGKAPKSRIDATPHILRVLVSFTRLELNDLLEEIKELQGTSGYLLLANQIMGKRA